jgi:ketosteroid isomerase-like protein
MTWREPLLGVLVLAASALPSGSQDRQGWSDQQILTRLEEDWDAAFLRNDVDVVADILADEFLATYDDGSRGDRERELMLVADFNQKVESSKLEDFRIRVYGDTAVVWFTRHLAGPSKGRRLEVTYRYLDVFVWRDGRWQCVASQSTKVANP